MVAAPDGTQSVRRAMTVLRLAACGQEQGVRLADVAVMAGLSRPTAHRLLRALVDECALEQDPLTRRYRIGPEMTLLGIARNSGLALRQVAEPYLDALAQQVGDAVFLTVRQGDDSVCIGRVLGHHAIQVLSIHVGVRRPLGASVSGIVLLAGLPAKEAARRLQANAQRLRHAGRDAAEVQRRVEASRTQGFTYAAEGVMPGTSALAVPVKDARGTVVAAISVAALAPRLDTRRLPTVRADMLAQSAMVTRRLEELAQAGSRRPAATRS